MIGKQVGNGECWTLAHDALDKAGAKRPGQDGLSAYEFGKKVSLSTLKPGDILQFEPEQPKRDGSMPAKGAEADERPAEREFAEETPASRRR